MSLKKTSAKAVIKRKHTLEQQRQRQKKFREQQKNTKVAHDRLFVKLNNNNNKKEMLKTRKMIQTKREYDRKKKQIERANLSHQKKAYIRVKDRERKAAARLKVKASSSTYSTFNSDCQKGFNSKKREWNVTSSIRTKLPRTPQKLATVVSNIVNNTTPRKRRALAELDQYGRKTEDNTIKKAKVSKPNCCGPRYSPPTVTAKIAARLLKRSRIRRKSKVDVIGIKKFYLREDRSRILPKKRYATKDGPGYSMQVSIEAAHLKYTSENPGKQVSLSKFASLRSKNVRKINTSHRNYCACVYCINVRFKLLTLSRAVSNSMRKQKNEGDLLDIILCPKGDNDKFHEPDCISASCKKMW